MQTAPSPGLGPVCSALDYCPKAMLGRGTEASMSELLTDLNFFYFKPGRDRCGRDANAGLESQSLCNAHTSVLAAV